MFGIPEKNLWWGSQKIIRSTFQNRRTAVKSGHSLSKDWSAGIIGVEWLLKYPFNSKVICTAPKMLQVKEIMMAEMKKQFSALQEHTPWPIAGDPIKSMKIDLGPEWYAIGMTTKESGGGEGGSIGKFQGFKSPNILIIISEAQSVEDNIFDQIEGMTTSGNAHILEIGNPISPSGRFWEHCTQPRFGYNVMTLSCFDSPNVVEKKEIIPGMVTIDWVEERRKEWGEDHPYWTARVLGEFPQSSSDCIIPIDWIMRAVNREIPDNDDLRVGGGDVSKGGIAETVHQPLFGRIAQPAQAFHKVDINETVGWAKNLIKTAQLKLYAVDEGGLAGVAGFLAEDNLPVMRIMFGAAVEDSEDFDNLGARMWWEIRKAFAPNSDMSISIPDDPILIGQLAARKYEYTSRGKRRIKLAQKSQNAADSNVLFDRADALVMAWWARMRMIYSGEEMISSGRSDSAELQQVIERASAYRGDAAEDLREISDVGSYDREAPDLD